MIWVSQPKCLLFTANKFTPTGVRIKICNVAKVGFLCTSGQYYGDHSLLCVGIWNLACELSMSWSFGGREDSETVKHGSIWTLLGSIRPRILVFGSLRIGPTITNFFVDITHQPTVNEDSIKEPRIPARSIISSHWCQGEQRDRLVCNSLGS